jgi:transcription antitermination factor NusG
MRAVWRKQRTGPRKRVEYPLIPSYLFVDVDLTKGNRTYSAKTILSIDGVINFLGVRGEPSECDLDKLDAIRRSEARGDYDETLAHIEQLLIGQKMTIEDGPFRDLTATITTICGNQVMADIQMFGRTMAVKISIDKLARQL